MGTFPGPIYEHPRPANQLSEVWIRGEWGEKGRGVFRCPAERAKCTKQSIGISIPVDR